MTWHGCKILLWGFALVLVGLARLPGIVQFVYPRDWFNDCFQDWASARFFLAGRPVYTNLAEAGTYVNWPGNPLSGFVEVNAHPPTSLLPFIPLALLPYPLACLIWNLLALVGMAASGWLVVTGLQLRLKPWMTLPFFTLLLLCHPFAEQVLYGQFNGVLLLLVVLAWRADRAGRPWQAGALVGLATVLKLSPAFLFLYFLVRGDWRALLGGAIATTGVTVATVAILGVGTYQDYVRDVVPHLTQRYASIWPNCSLPGYWHKLFAGTGEPGRTVSVYHDPALASLASHGSTLAVVALVTLGVWLARSRTERDLAFGLTLTGMLLVSPITWTHYTLLLLLPLTLWFVELRPWSWPRWLLWPCTVVLWLPSGPLLFWGLGMGLPLLKAPEVWEKVPTSPRAALTGASVCTYALLGLFVVGLAALRQVRRRT